MEEEDNDQDISSNSSDIAFLGKRIRLLIGLSKWLKNLKC